MKTTQQLYKAFYSAIRSGGMHEAYKAFQSALDERGLSCASTLSFRAERIHCQQNRGIHPYCDLGIRLTTYKHKKRQKAEQVAICTDNGLDLMLLNK